MSVKKVILMMVVLGLAGFSGKSFADRSEFRDEINEYREEIRESTQRERLQSAEVNEVRTEEDTEKGKTLIDVNGNRVRVEKYFSMPAANKISVLVLNTREDLGRIDQNDWTVTFNRNLPEDLRGIGRTMWGSTPQYPGAPKYYVTNILGISSSGDNNLKHTRDDGWLFYSTEDIATVVFNDEKLSINGIDKFWHERVDYNKNNNLFGVIQIYFPDANSNLALCLKRWIGGEEIVNADVIPLPDSKSARQYGELRDFGKFTFADGTWLSRKRFFINNEGEVLPLGTPFWKGNLEIITEASEFNGETIDIVIIPESAEEASLDIN